MSKVVRPPFSWKVLIHDFNSATIKTHDVLAYREDFIKKLKKKCVTKEEFADTLARDFMRQYWSRSEYEMILYIENNRVYLEPWVGTFKEGRIDITTNETLDWPGFAEELLSIRGWSDKENNRIYAKFDIYDQLMFRFDELLDFCWNYKHKYQRNKLEGAKA